MLAAYQEKRGRQQFKRKALETMFLKLEGLNFFKGKKGKGQKLMSKRETPIPTLEDLEKVSVLPSTHLYKEPVHHRLNGVKLERNFGIPLELKFL